MCVYYSDEVVNHGQSRFADVDSVIIVLTEWKSRL